ncbi:MAG TPA: hypothetical protein VGI43_09625 [Mucilaginibacter sp.]
MNVRTRGTRIAPGKSLLKTQSHAELVSAPHETSGLLGVRLVYSFTWRILCIWGADPPKADGMTFFLTLKDS